MTFQSGQQALINAIAAQPGMNPQIAAAMLVGAEGESSQVPTAGTASAGGYFGQTTPYYPSGSNTLSASAQVAQLFKSYQTAAASIPSDITTQPAQAEWIALTAESPAFSTPATIKKYGLTKTGPTTEEELGYSWYNVPVMGVSQTQAIEQTGQPTQYGANTSYPVASEWQSLILPELEAIGMAGKANPGQTIPPVTINVPGSPSAGGGQTLTTPANASVDNPAGTKSPSSGFGQFYAAIDHVLNPTTISLTGVTFGSVISPIAQYLWLGAARGGGVIIGLGLTLVGIFVMTSSGGQTSVPSSFLNAYARTSGTVLARVPESQAILNQRLEYQRQLSQIPNRPNP